MMRRLFTALLMAGAIGSGAPALANEGLRCSIDYRPDRACTMTDRVENGVHHLEFRLDDGRRVIFIGRSQTGWWSGVLDGKPAMGFERNRSHVIFSTADLQTTFTWWRPGSEHGTY